MRQPDPATTSGPVRTCVGCRRRVAKRELLRVVVGSDSHGRPAVVPDPRATRAGRGAYLHLGTECFELAVRRKAFARALRWRGTGTLDTAMLETHLRQEPRSAHAE